MIEVASDLTLRHRDDVAVSVAMCARFRLHSTWFQWHIKALLGPLDFFQQARHWGTKANASWVRTSETRVFVLICMSMNENDLKSSLAPVKRKYRNGRIAKKNQCPEPIPPIVASGTVVALLVVPNLKC